MEKPVHPLRLYRKEAGKSLEDVAKDVGASAATISRIENWSQTPSLDLVGKLKAITGLPADAFLAEAAP